MTRKERYCKENFEKAVNKASSIKGALKNLGLRAAGGNYKIFHKYVKEYNLDTSHFEEKGAAYYKSLRKSAQERKIPLEEILVENSTYSRGHLKERLYKEGLKKRECEDCEQGEVWREKKISLILDHKNGIHDDNRLENLQILCPNCNATLPTHCRRK